MYLTTKSYMAKLAINKSLLKEYQTSDAARTVYMQNDDEFQIQLFNPERYTIGAEVYINGERLSGVLVLKPGERIWLERYTDKAVKFKFSTYEVENTSEVQHAIAYNGKIEIKFYKERPRNYTYISTAVNYWDCPITSVSNTNLNYKNYANNEITSSNANTCYNNSLLGLDIISGENDAKCCTLTNSCLNATETASSAFNKSIKSCNSKSIETGRVAEGNYSHQKFDNINIDFEYYPFHTENLTILPFSRKPINKNDLQKIYCTQCGRKLNTKYKFCPYCGAKCVQC